MEHRLPSLRKELSTEVVGDLHRRDQASVRPLSNLVMRPDHDIGSFACLGSNRKIVRYILGRLDCDLDTKIGIKFLGDSLNRFASFAVHPNQQLTVSPGEYIGRSQNKGRQNQEQPRY